MDRPDQGSEVRTRLPAGGRWIRTIGTPQRNDFSRPPPFDPPQFAFRKRNRLLRTRNRWFESTSLHGESWANCETLQERVRRLIAPSACLERTRHRVGWTLTEET